MLVIPERVIRLVVVDTRVLRAGMEVVVGRMGRGMAREVVVREGGAGRDLVIGGSCLRFFLLFVRFVGR